MSQEDTITKLIDALVDQARAIIQLRHEVSNLTKRVEALDHGSQTEEF